MPGQRIQRVAARDGWLCAYCGRKLGYALGLERPTVDHVVPKSRGGTSDMANLVLACGPCNGRKGSDLWQPIGWEPSTQYVERDCRHKSAAAFCFNCAGP